MDTCYLFSKFLDDAGCLSLKLSSEGVVVAPLLQRDFVDIKPLQESSHTIIIESSDSASFIDLELPWLPERKARIAIPYAIEEKLSEPIDNLHFAFDKNHYQNNHYLVVVISKSRIQYIMNILANHTIEYDYITLDWFALEPGQLCVSDNTLIINNDDFKGTLSGELATTYLTKHPLNQAYMFRDSLIKTNAPVEQIDEHSFNWLAQRISNSKPLNLCQGEMQHGNNSDWITKGYKIAGALAALWLVSILITNGLSVYSLNKKNNVINEKIAVIFHEFFPEAKQVVSPKFRISQLLKNNASDNQAHFWFMLNQFAKASHASKINVEQLRFQSNKFSVTLASPDFPSLERFQNALKTLQLKVKQTQASTRDQQVVATLELS